MTGQQTVISIRNLVKTYVVGEGEPGTAMA